ncbi:MAG: hypothetical protein R6U13_13905 [Desulfatiglandaceae bacterium]
MISDGMLWLPVVATAVLMYLARVSHIAVLHYNVFLILLLVWGAVIIAFFRFLCKGGVCRKGIRK